MIKIMQPKVTLIAMTEAIWDNMDEFIGRNYPDSEAIAYSPDASKATEAIPEFAGRLCYMSHGNPRPGGNRTYLQHIKEVGHGSILLHSNFTFVFEGVSRSLTHELVRHGAGTGYSQLSQRYVDESVAEYVEPDIIANDPELHAIWLKSVEQSHAAYVELADKLAKKLYNWEPTRMGMSSTDRRKAARQAARSVLPNATETKIVVTANARAWRHIIEMRGAADADVEIRRLANLVFDQLEKAAPNLFNDYHRSPLPDGTFEIKTPYRKV